MNAIGTSPSAAGARVLSLLPTATTIVLALGAGERLAGVSHDHQLMEAVRHLPVVNRLGYDDRNMSSREIDQIVSSTYADGRSIYILDAEAIARLQPTLILTQRLCEVCAITPSDLQATLAGLKPAPALVELHAHTLGEALAEMQAVAAALGLEERGAELVARLSSRMQKVAERAAAAGSRPSVFCLEWPDPLYNAGHWVPEMVELAGGRDELAHPGGHSSRIEWQRLREYDPEFIVAAVCGFPRERAQRELQILRQRPGFYELQAVRRQQFWVADGPRFFSQAGPGLWDGLELLAGILHPELFPAPQTEAAVRFET